MKLDPDWKQYRPNLSDEQLKKLIRSYEAKLELHQCSAVPAWVGHELLRCVK